MKLDDIDFTLEETFKVLNGGIKIWYINGFIHREDGPAIEYPNGTKKWYKYGMTHREDGPAIEWADGDKYWFNNGKLHREDGPAIQRNEIKNPNEKNEWWLDGIKCK